MSLVFVGFGFHGVHVGPRLWRLTSDADDRPDAGADRRDSGALAGATAIAFNSATDQSDTGPAKKALIYREAAATTS